MNTCENCAHRFIDFGNGQSVCRRYPPTVHITPQGQGLTMFPPVNGQMVCGEWKAEDKEIVQ